MERVIDNQKKKKTYKKRNSHSLTEHLASNPFLDCIVLNMERSPMLNEILLGNTYRFPEHAVILITEGTLKVDVSLESLSLEKHSLLLIPANSVITVQDRSDNVNYRSISFPTFCSEQNDLIGYEPIKIQLQGNSHSTIENYFQLMDMLMRKKDKDNTEGMQHLILSLLSHINTLNDTMLQSIGLLNLPHPQQLKSEFLYLLNSEPYPIRTVSYYTDKLSVTPGHLNNVMKKLTGMSTTEWINKNTIRAARELLSNPAKYYTVVEIAELLHCGTEPNFSKFFKSHTGETPSEFRKRIQQK